MARPVIVVLGGLAWFGASAAFADPAADRSAIAARLAAWTQAFNARDAAQTCDLFSSELKSSMRGRPDERRDAVCKRIAAALANPAIQITYAPDIQDILVDGDLAVVRLVWSVTTKRGTREAKSSEPGIDVFRRERDGVWRIYRFVAFSTDE